MVEERGKKNFRESNISYQDPGPYIIYSTEGVLRNLKAQPLMSMIEAGGRGIKVEKVADKRRER